MYNVDSETSTKLQIRIPSKPLLRTMFLYSNPWSSMFQTVSGRCAANILAERTKLVSSVAIDLSDWKSNFEILSNLPFAGKRLWSTDERESNGAVHLKFDFTVRSNRSIESVDGKVRTVLCHRISSDACSPASIRFGEHYSKVNSLKVSSLKANGLKVNSLKWMPETPQCEVLLWSNGSQHELMDFNRFQTQMFLVDFSRFQSISNDSQSRSLPVTVVKTVNRVM